MQFYFGACDSVTRAKYEYLDVCDRLLFFRRRYSKLYVIPHTLVIHRTWSLTAVHKVQGVESVKFITPMLVTLRTIVNQLKNYWYQREKELKMGQLWLYFFI